MRHESQIYPWADADCNLEPKFLTLENNYMFYIVFLKDYNQRGKKSWRFFGGLKTK